MTTAVVQTSGTGVPSHLYMLTAPGKVYTAGLANKCAESNKKKIAYCTGDVGKHRDKYVGYSRWVHDMRNAAEECTPLLSC